MSTTYIDDGVSKPASSLADNSRERLPENPKVSFMKDLKRSNSANVANLKRSGSASAPGMKQAKKSESTLGSKPNNGSANNNFVARKEQLRKQAMDVVDIGALSTVVGALRKQMHTGDREHDNDNESNSSSDEDEEDEYDMFLTSMSTGRVKQQLREAEEEADAWLAVLIGEETLVFLEDEAKYSESIATWVWFDSFFSVLVVANGGLMAAVADGYLKEDSIGMQLTQIGFFIVFSFEFAYRVRYRMGYESKRADAARISQASEMHRVGSRERVRQIHRKERGSCRSKCALCRAVMRDWWMRFDLVMLAITSFDIAMLFYTWAAGPEGMNPRAGDGVNAMPILRIFRMLKMVRLFRLVRLMKELWLLVSGMMQSIQVLIWLLFALILFVCIFALCFYELISAKPEDDLYKYWGSFPRTIITLLQITTHDGWADIVRRLVLGSHETQEQGMPILLFILVPYIVVTTHGIMNLIIGVMLTSALQVTSSDEKYQDHMAIIQQRKTLLELRRECLRRCCQERGLKPFALRSDEAPITRSMVRRWMSEEVEDLGEEIALESVKIIVNNARGLRQADLIGHSDPYCTVQVEGVPETTLKTPAIQDTKDPDWNAELVFTNYDPRRAILLDVWDLDTNSVDHLGSARVTSDRFYVQGQRDHFVDLVLPLQDAGLGVRATISISIGLLSENIQLESEIQDDELQDEQAISMKRVPSASQGDNHASSRISYLLAECGIKGEDVDTIFDEVDSVMGLSHSFEEGEQSISVAAFVMGCTWIKSRVMPLDMMRVKAGLHSMNDRLMNLDEQLCSALQEVNRVMQALEPLLVRYHNEHSHHQHHTHNHRREQKEQSAKDKLKSAQRSATGLVIPIPRLANTKTRNLSEVKEEIRFLEIQRKADEEEQAYARFDMLFGGVAIANGLIVGAQAAIGESSSENKTYVRFDRPMTGDTLQLIWFYFDSVFLIIFGIEFALRLVLYYQIEIEHETSMRYAFIPESVTRLTRYKLTKITQRLPLQLAKDKYLLIDLLILALGGVDLWIMHFIFGTSTRTPVFLLKMFRLIRVLRLVRVMYLMRPVSLMVTGLFNSMGLLFWSLAILLLVVYMGAILVVEVLGDLDTFGDPEIEQYWGTLRAGMLTMFRMATFEEWILRIREVNEYSVPMGYFLLLFVCIASVGILWLVIGILVQAAFGIVQSEKAEQQRLNVTNAKDRLIKAKCQILEDRRRIRGPELKRAIQRKLTKSSSCASRHLHRSRTTDSQISSKSFQSDIYGAGSIDSSSSSSSSSSSDEDEKRNLAEIHRENLGVNELCMFLEDETLMALLHKVNIRTDQVVTVFLKLAADDGRVMADDFVDGILRLKEGMRGIDVTAAKSWARRNIREAEHLHKDATECRECFVKIVERLRGVTVGGGHGRREMAENEAAKHGYHSGFHTIEKRCRNLEKENASLRLCAERLRTSIDVRRKMMQAMDREQDIPDDVETANSNQSLVDYIGVDNVSENKMEEYCASLADRLASGHDSIKRHIHQFLDEQCRQLSSLPIDTPVLSNFDPFYVKDSDSGSCKSLRILVEISVTKAEDQIHVAYSTSKTASAIADGGVTRGAVPALRLPAALGAASGGAQTAALTASAAPVASKAMALKGEDSLLLSARGGAD